MELYTPLALGAIMFVSEFCEVKFALLNAPWGNRLLDRVIQASAIGTAFWSVAITLLIALDSKPVVIRLKSGGYYKIVVRNLGECVLVMFVLLLLSIVMEPLSNQFSPVLLSACWFGAAVWAVAAAVRSYVVLADVLLRVAEQA